MQGAAHSISGSEAFRRRSGSPDADALVWSDIELGIRTDAKRRVPGIEIADRPDHTEARRCVRVRRDLRLDRILALLAPPSLRERQEEALVTGQAVDHRRRL